MEHEIETENKPQKKSGLFDWIMIIAVLVILLAWLYPAVNYSLSGGPGDAYLYKQPEESRRVYNSDGTSIIRPEGWQIQEPLPPHEFMFSAGSSRHPCRLSGMSDQSEGEQVPSSIQSRLKDAALRPTMFQGEPAFEYVTQDNRSGGMEDPSWLRGGIYFFRNNRCYLLEYQFSVYEEVAPVPPNLRAYLESFQAPSE